MTNKRDCENCVHAKPFGGENDNRCDAWECEYIDRKEAIKAYIGLVRCGECVWHGDNNTCIHRDALIIARDDDFCSKGEREIGE